MGKRTKLNQKANKKLKDIFQEKGITRCEKCGSNIGLTWAHRKKRRHYKTVEQLSDPQEVILLCLQCHINTEYDKEATEELFNRLR